MSRTSPALQHTKTPLGTRGSPAWGAGVAAYATVGKGCAGLAVAKGCGVPWLVKGVALAEGLVGATVRVQEGAAVAPALGVGVGGAAVAEARGKVGEGVAGRREAVGVAGSAVAVEAG